MFKKTALVAGIGLALSVTAQADYRWELGGDYTYSEIDADVRNNSNIGNKSDDIDENKGSLYGTWYMENVDTSKGPLNEAAFLDHASSITIFGSDGEVDLSSLDDRLDDQDGQTYGANMRYVAEGPGWKLSGVLVDVGYERREPGDAEIDVYNLGIGYYLTSNTTLVADYQKININNGGDTDGYRADLDHFFAFSRGGLKVNLGGGRVIVNDANDVDLYNVGATWYINNNLGFGANYQNASQDGYEINGWDVNANWFITESFAMDLSYGQVDFDDINLAAVPVRFPGGGKLELEKDVAKLGAKFRF